MSIDELTRDANDYDRQRELLGPPENWPDPREMRLWEIKLHKRGIPGPTLADQLQALLNVWESHL